MGKAIITGLVSWVSGYDFIINDNGTVIQCKSDHPPHFGTVVTVEGAIRSYIKLIDSTAVVLNYIQCK